MIDKEGMIKDIKGCRFVNPKNDKQIGYNEAINEVISRIEYNYYK